MIEIHEAPHGSPLYVKLTALREAVLRVPLGLRFTAEDIASEVNDTHLAACDGDDVVGSILLRDAGDSILQIKRMAVAADRQGQGVGRLLVEDAERRAQAAGFKAVMMHARETAVGFYESCGYTITSDIFLETGLPHRRMEKIVS